MFSSLLLGTCKNTIPSICRTKIILIETKYFSNDRPYPPTNPILDFRLINLFNN